MNVLFIGNSYTFYNDMPKLFEGICREHGLDVTVESLTKGGYSLAHFLSEENPYGVKLRERIAGGKFDYIVLQEQSVLPAQHPETFLRNVGKMAELLKPTGAKLVLYETWGRRDGHPVLTDNNWTHEQMQELLKAAYAQAAEQIGAILVPAGERLSAAYRGADGDAVYHTDGTHPSPVGSRIVADCFYETLFGRK